MSEFSTPFDPSKIKMTSKVQSIYALMARVGHGEIVTPSYQRSDVWDKVAKSRLIESLIIRIPIPVFYMDATDDDEWKIVDGLQRITALKEFLIDKTLKLEQLEYITELNGYSFDELPRAFQRRIEETDVTVILINPGTPDSVKYNIFKRINTGGLPLSGQEIRHALNDGKATPCLAQLVEVLGIGETWGRGKGTDDENKRMEYNELVLRAFSLWFLKSDMIYESNIDDYLTAGMHIINQASDDELSKKKDDFINAYKTIQAIFDKNAFRKLKKDSDSRSVLNKNVYEIWMYVMHKLTPAERKLTIVKKQHLIKGFTELLQDSRFQYAVNSRKGESMRYRNDAVLSLVWRFVR